MTRGRRLYRARLLLLLFLQLQLLLLLQPLPTHARAGVWAPRDTFFDENRTDLEGEGPAGRAPGGEDENRAGFYEASTFFYFCALLGVSFAGLLLLCGCCLCEARSLPRIVYGFGRGAALGPLPLHPPSRARTSVDFYTRG